LVIVKVFKKKKLQAFSFKLNVSVNDKGIEESVQQKSVHVDDGSREVYSQTECVANQAFVVLNPKQTVEHRILFDP
jgi:P2-related tail formation protein